MLISCEKCATTYVLDEALVPPAGAAVQCTRCSHVFTAFPPKSPAPQLSSVAAAGVASQQPANQTPANQTPANQTPANQTPANQTPANQTMMFGSSSPSGARANQTMMFGANSNAADLAPANSMSAARPAHQTMMFGAGGGPVPSKPVAPPTNQTLVFGTAAGQGLAGGTSQGKQAPSSQTLVFGAKGSELPQEPPVAPAGGGGAAHQTLMFGAAPVSPAPNQTMMFGTGAGQQLVAEVNEGAVDAAPVNQTLPFGSPAVSSPAVSSPAKSTQMFGAPVLSPPGRSGVSTTMMFGAPASEKPAPARPNNSTMMFGRLPEPPPDAPNAPNKTLAFGVPVVSAAPVLDLEPAGAERTVRVELDGVSGGGPDGTPLRPVDSGPARHDRTALFAMSESDTASTQRQEATPADGAITLPPQAHVAGAENLFSTQKYDVGLPASTLPAMPPLRDVADLSNPAPIKLSMLSETDLASVAGTVPERQALSSQDFSADSEAAAIANAGRRRNMIALAVVSVLVVVAGVAAGWMIFGKQLLAPQVSPSIRAAVEQSVSKLRVDDRSTRAAEVARLEKIIKEIPQFSEAHAALVVALALEFDDLHAENSAIVARYKPLRAKFDALDDATKARPEGRKIGGAVNALVDQQKALSERDRVLREKVEKAQRAMEAAVAEVEPGPSGELAVLRARALVKAISGSAAARELAAKGGGDDYWLKLVPASLALNVEGTPKGELEAALASLDGLRNSDETAGFPRPHFLAARLFVALGDKEKAMAALDKSLKVSPDYAPAVSVKKLLAGWEP